VAFGFRVTILFATVIGAYFWFMNKSKVNEMMDESVE